LQLEQVSLLDHILQVAVTAVYWFCSPFGHLKIFHGQLCQQIGGDGMTNGNAAMVASWLVVDMLLKLSNKRPLLFKYCSMLLIQHSLSHAWKNGLQSCITLSVNLRPPLSLAFFANSARSIAKSTSLDCTAFSLVPVYGFLINTGPVHCVKMVHIPSCLRMGLYACISLYLLGVLVLRKDFLAWCVWATFRSRKIECKK
jgi:hypothetical protein